MLALTAISITRLSALFCLISELGTTVYASLAITSPVNSIWEAGTKNLITWIETGEESPAPVNIALDLMQGPATSLQPVQSITKSANVKEGQHSWEIPKTLPPGNYSIRAGIPPNVVYSTYFEIKGSSLGGSSSAISSTPKPGRKPGKGTRKNPHEDPAKKPGGLGGLSSDNIITATTASPSDISNTVQKPSKVIIPADNTSPTGVKDQKVSPPSALNTLGAKKSHENAAANPKLQLIGFIVYAAFSTLSYFC